MTGRKQKPSGIENIIADSESRVMRDRSDWKLNPTVFRRIQDSLGPLEVDLFASRLTAQLPRYFSWHPDPQAEATDALLQDWRHLRGYANPPWNLVGRVLAKAREQEATLVLVAPIWPAQTASQQNLMTPCVCHGSAGVVDGVVIPFQDLYKM